MAVAPLPSADTINPTTGMPRTLSAEERRTRSESLRRALVEMAGITDDTDTDEVWAEVYRGIDEARPHRPLFKGRC